MRQPLILTRQARTDVPQSFVAHPTAIDGPLRFPRERFDLVIVHGLWSAPPAATALLNAIRNALVPHGSCLVVVSRPSGESVKDAADAAGFGRVDGLAVDGAEAAFELRR